MPDQSRIPVPRGPDAFARDIAELVKDSSADGSALRHSLGRAPKDAPLAVHRIIAPRIRAGSGEAAERAYYMVAAVIASQDRDARDQQGTAGAHDTAGSQPGGGTGTGRGQNFGCSLARAAHKHGDDKRKNMENRLELLTRQDLEGLYRHLPRLALQVRGEKVRIDWGVLIRDLTPWAEDPRQVAKEWAQAFYRTSEQIIRDQKRESQQPAEDQDKETNS